MKNQNQMTALHSKQGSHTLCPRSSDPFYIIISYIKWVTSSWTHNIIKIKVLKEQNTKRNKFITQF